RRPRPTRPGGRSPGRGTPAGHASTSRRWRSRGRHSSRTSLRTRQRLVIPEQQLLVFLQRLVRDLLGDLDDGLVVLPAPSFLEAGTQHLQSELLELAAAVFLVLLEHIQQCFLEILLQIVWLVRNRHVTENFGLSDKERVDI